MSLSAMEVAHRAASDAELVAWVDEADQLLGSVPRAELRARGLIGRGTFILLFNMTGELCVHQRTLSKALYPGYWDVAAGGMVQVDESYAESAARELAEELGVAGVVLHEHGRFLFEQTDNRLWCAVFSAHSDAPLRLQPEEVLQARFLALDAVLAATAQQPFCPDSLDALQRYLAEQAG
jgi:isopentenyldiphosphate isomerase